jgi:hypothetical protein
MRCAVEQSAGGIKWDETRDLQSLGEQLAEGFKSVRGARVRKFLGERKKRMCVKDTNAHEAPVVQLPRKAPSKKKGSVAGFRRNERANALLGWHGRARSQQAMKKQGEAESS